MVATVNMAQLLVLRVCIILAPIQLTDSFMYRPAIQELTEPL
jgi:hypothetical protein